MKKYIFSLFLIFSASIINAQTYSIELDSVQKIGTDLFFDVRIKANGGTFNLGFADVKFAYEKSAFGTGAAISRVSNSQKTVDAAGALTTLQAHSLSGVFSRDSRITLVLNGTWVQETEQYNTTAVIGSSFIRVYKMKITNFIGTTTADAGLVFVKRNSVFYKVGSDFKYTKLVYLP